MPLTLEARKNGEKIDVLRARDDGGSRPSQLALNFLQRGDERLRHVVDRGKAGGVRGGVRAVRLRDGVFRERAHVLWRDS